MQSKQSKQRKQQTILPVEVVFAPSWWYKQTGITFDRDFFMHPDRRVEDEQKMEKLLYDKWGQYGMGADHAEKRPEIGAVHLASGFMLSEMLGCEIDYFTSEPPQVRPAQVDSLNTACIEQAFEHKTFKDFTTLCDTLETKYGYITGDVNWGGILNLALDLRGQEIFMDFYDDPDQVKVYFDKLFEMIDRFTRFVGDRTGTTSLSVNRLLRHLDKPVLLQSQCSHTMISESLYETFLMTYDLRWSKQAESYGIHYCGEDPHRFASLYGQLPHLDYVDVGYGGDVTKLRKFLPNSFLGLRLSPVKIKTMSIEEITQDITKLVQASADPAKTGICCINVDGDTPDEKIDVIFETVAMLRKALSE